MKASQLAMKPSSKQPLSPKSRFLSGFKLPFVSNNRATNVSPARPNALLQSNKVAAASTVTEQPQSDGLGILQYDSNLQGHTEHLKYRYNQYLRTKQSIEQHEGSLADFALGYKTYGIVHENGKTVYREWAPAAQAAMLIGDFNNWAGTAMERDEFGLWSVTLPDGMLFSFWFSCCLLFVLCIVLFYAT